MPVDGGFPWHRVFHPLCGADPLTLVRLMARRGPPSVARAPTFAVACAMAGLRLPFTLIERALDAAAPASIGQPPVFVIGHPRSGTTHLHNALAASGAFTIVPPVIAVLPWERRTIGPLMRPFVAPYLPRTRLIDGVALGPDAPTEDELALANLAAPSYFHALYFPSRLATDWRDGLLNRHPPADAARRERALRRYVTGMARRGTAPLLLKNPAYTTVPDMLTRLFPGARVVHIRRDPVAVYASTRRALRAVLGELALQDWSQADIDSIVLDTYPQVMAGLAAATGRMPSGSFAEVRFDALVGDPGGTLGVLWRTLGLPGGGAAARRAADYCNGLAGFRRTTPDAAPADVAMLRRRWPEAMRDWPRRDAA